MCLEDLLSIVAIWVKRVIIYTIPVQATADNKWMTLYLPRQQYLRQRVKSHLQQQQWNRHWPYSQQHRESSITLPEASGQYLNIFPYPTLAASLSKMILGVHFATELSGNFFWVIGVSLLSWRQSIALPIAESSSEKSGVFREDLFRGNEPPQSFCLTFPALLATRNSNSIQCFRIPSFYTGTD
jgi:hypothetical protein